MCLANGIGCIMTVCVLGKQPRLLSHSHVAMLLVPFNSCSLQIKVFVKKTGAAMVQMERRDGAQNAIKHLNGAPFMGRELQIRFVDTLL